MVASLLGYEKISRALTVQSAILTVDLNLAPKPVDIGEILVEDERVYSAASSRSVRKFDLQTRPNRSAQDMLQMAPGLIIAQHAGGGKAEQIFLRNFDADHGTDVALSVDGIPVNMVSHGHGQGYADMHFLIPDVVDG
ncbi:MAG: Plug domain-containing protein, partial [Calditrichaeota bacterium]|nr:Plug domain-containing protein [Calditrichota bacterium]